MKFRSLGQATLALAVVAGLATLITSCGGGHTIGYAYITTSPSTSSAAIFGFTVRNDTGDLWPAKTPATVNPYSPAAVATVVSPDNENLYVLYGAPTDIQTGLPISTNSQSQVVHYGIQLDSGNITPIDTQNTGGNEAVGLAIDPNGLFLYAIDSFQAAYNTGSPGPGDVTVWSIQPHSSTVPGGVLTAPSCTTGTVVPNGAGCYYPVGWGPRGVTQASSGGNYSLYVTNSGNTAPASNSNCFSTVSGFQVNSTSGALTPIDLSSASVGSCAGTPYPSNSMPVQGMPWGVAAAAASSGAYVYVTDTSANDQVYAFSSASATGALTLLPFSSSQPGIPTGVEPEHIMALSGSKGAYLDLYVSNFNSGTVSAYTIAPSTGALTPASGSPYAVGSKPTCMAADPTGTYFYVTNYISGSISGFRLGGATGTLTQVPNTPFVVGTTIGPNNTNYPTCIAILPN